MVLFLQEKNFLSTVSKGFLCGPLTLYPAIDLKGGACVRLRRGEMDQATVYGDDPGAQAAAWQDAGCHWLHVVDLDGAFAGRSVNTEAVRAILATARVPVQLGGGIRDLASIEAWLTEGVTRVILGSVAANNPSLVREACRVFPGRIAVGIDARDGFVATEGWAETSSLACRGSRAAVRGCGCFGNHLHGYRAGRDAGWSQPRRHCGSGAGGDDAGDRVRRGRFDWRSGGSAGGGDGDARGSRV